MSKVHRRSGLQATALMLLIAAACIAQAACLGQEDAKAKNRTPEQTPAPRSSPSNGGVRRCLIICGLPGDADHRKLFAETLELLYTGLTKHHGFAAENVHTLWGDKPTEKDGAAVRASRAVASRETIAAAAKTLRTALQPDDTLWVFVVGHAHYDGRYSWLNVASDDLHQLDFARLFEGLRCREQAFFMTTAASGFYLKPLAAPGRIVIAATEPDLEVNETLFPHKLAKAIASPPPAGEFDIDRDKRLTLLDLYLWTARETAQEYKMGELLATEHALIDDNGDGRGTEVQIDYLPEELGGRRRAGLDSPSPKGDGALARRVLLAYPTPPPASDAKKK